MTKKQSKREGERNALSNIFGLPKLLNQYKKEKIK